MKFLLPLLLFTSCGSIFNITNTGVVGKGDNTGNTSEITQEFLDIKLTAEQVKIAKDAFQRGKDAVLKSQATLSFIDSQVKLPYESNISRSEFKKKFPELVKERAHRDLVTILHLVYKMYPKFKIVDVARSKAQQRRNVAKGVSQTMNSRHLTDPVQAADVNSTRHYFPDRKGENVDAETLGYTLGLTDGIGLVLAQYPCEYFASIVERVFLWKTIRDLFHRQVDPRPGCKENYHKYVET